MHLLNWKLWALITCALWIFERWCHYLCGQKCLLSADSLDQQELAVRCKVTSIPVRFLFCSLFDHTFFSILYNEHVWNKLIVLINTPIINFAGLCGCGVASITNGLYMYAHLVTYSLCTTFHRLSLSFINKCISHREPVDFKALKLNTFPKKSHFLGLQHN